MVAKKVDYVRLTDAALFRGMPDDTLIELSAYCHYQELSAGETLFHQDDPSNALFILEDGQIHVVRKYPDNEEVILATEDPFYVIGELSMLANQPRTGSVVAVSDCTLIALKRDAFMAACANHPNVASYMIEYLGQRNYRMNLQVRERSIGNPEARIASILILLPCDDSGEITSNASLHRLARGAAVDVKTIERTFKQWAKDGYIEYTRDKLCILDGQAIQFIAG
jgi:CRP-like cAMP-binding protein